MVFAQIRRLLVMGLLLAVALIAFLPSAQAQRGIVVDLCEHAPCVGHSGAPSPAEHQFPGHDSCLHDAGCGGGGALSLGGLMLAVVAATRLLPTPPDYGLLRRPRRAVSSPIELLVGGIERPPRFAH